MSSVSHGRSQNLSIAGDCDVSHVHAGAGSNRDRLGLVYDCTTTTLRTLDDAEYDLTPATAIRGIGTRRAEALAKVGLTTAQHIAETTTDTITDATGVSRKVAKGWRRAARDLLNA